jgi:hypothetical protein
VGMLTGQATHLLAYKSALGNRIVVGGEHGGIKVSPAPADRIPSREA